MLRTLQLDFNFIIFTKEKHVYEKELYSIKDKISINGYIERNNLISVLHSADFLVHFPYQNDTQRSLKLVDYAYSGSPVLSYKGSTDNEIVMQFLKGDYKNKLTLENINPYKIENVVGQFLKLIK